MRLSKPILVLVMILAIPAAALTACFVHGAFAVPVPLPTCITAHHTATPAVSVADSGIASWPLVPQLFEPPATPRLSYRLPEVLALAEPDVLHGRLRI